MFFSLNEDQIKEVERVLATETTAAALADRLFSPDGLFVRWSSTEEERRALTKTSVFKQAQARFRELQTDEASRFSAAVGMVQKKDVAELFRWDGLTPLQGK